MNHKQSNTISTLFQSESQIHDLISRADDNAETKRLIIKFNELKKTRIPFYLTIDEFDEILHWKLRKQYYRQLKIRKQNTDLFVRTITQSAFAIENVDENYETEQRLKMLIKLNGVQIPVASAILTLCYPDKYSVIDFRGWRQIYGAVKKYSNYTTKEYINYLSIIKQMAINIGVTTQQVDMAIWQYDIENRGKKT
jgi:thermostable 8-oxoguanine DNA glycosylase